MQVWLQEFCWTEDEKASRLVRRNATMATDEKHMIEKEPMFCMETMMKCLYWSLLVYDFEGVSPFCRMLVRVHCPHLRQLPTSSMLHDVAQPLS